MNTGRGGEQSRKMTGPGYCETSFYIQLICLKLHFNMCHVSGSDLGHTSSHTYERALHFLPAISEPVSNSVLFLSFLRLSFHSSTSPEVSAEVVST